jgi:tRNA threonylcarbamoyladenosine biosynthesis protein TsaE
MTDRQTTLSLPDAEATAERARALAPQLEAGDVILLEGDVGAGKTHFARALIQSILPVPEDVPSPTFTLIQTYDSRLGPVWHADLYRITSTPEIEELGLAEAFESAICLVEWPDRLAEIAPPEALCLSFTMADTLGARDLRAEWSATKWNDKLAGWRG